MDSELISRGERPRYTDNLIAHHPLPITSIPSTSGSMETTDIDRGERPRNTDQDLPMSLRRSVSPVYVTYDFTCHAAAHNQTCSCYYTAFHSPLELNEDPDDFSGMPALDEPAKLRAKL